MTEAGEVLLVKEKEDRRGGVKLGKRQRAASQCEPVSLDGVLVKKKKISESEPDTQADIVEVKSEDEEVATETKKSKKKKKKKDKDVVVETEEVKQKEEAVKEENPADVKDSTTKKLVEPADPGWNFSATCITTPSWKKSSIWSDDELEEDDDKDEADKTHVSKAEAKRMKRAEEEMAAAREQRVLDGEVKRKRIYFSL